ncbi:MAG: hypothetical protein GX823_06090 [Clostridiales bacterium]|nr:hypothetical protein [Clostridiales bacterium]
MAILKLNYNTATFKLCFDTKASGRIVGQRLQAPIAFFDLPEMLLKIDAVMDLQDYPRAFQRKRKFENVSEKAVSVPYAVTAEDMMDSEVVDGSSGELATITLQVMTRQNATWQGSVTDGSERLMFDSVLQLLGFIDKLTN